MATQALWIALGLSWSAIVGQTTLTIPDGEELTALLRKDHPRLIATAEDFARLKEQVCADKQMKLWHGQLIENAELILKEPPSKYEIPDGKRLLSTSRRVLDRTYTLSMAYRTMRDKRYVERAWAELSAAAAFPDWNPSHFLDTAEMTHAFAIGYDWLYDAWTAEQREALKKAIIEMGLKPGLECYAGAKSYGWWVGCRHNWNQVCNGGLGMGALAIGDVEPQLAGKALHAALKSLPLAMAEFAPDGAWGEGPGYWAYATSYNVVFLAALETALGTDFGLSEIPGFSATGDFPVWMTGATGDSFAYADCHARPIGGPQLLWLARRFSRPEWARHQIRLAKPHALDLVAFNRQLADAPAQPPPFDKYFRRAEVVTLRGSWDDPKATFIGFKAGDNKFNHSHLDIGTFTLDALGQRWAVDLGSDNYNLPGYFGGHRWEYYRLRAEGHNTLVINPGQEPDQDPRAACRIIRFESAPHRASAVADLTPAYARSAVKVLRGMALINRQGALVQDEIETNAQAEAWWFLHTKAQINLSDDRKSATLRQDDALLTARLLEPAGGEFSVMEAEPLPGSPHPKKQGDNKGVRKLAVHLRGITNTRIAVWLTPSIADTPPENKQLGDW
ncbi:MAG TPA: heparinase II/III family protein [Candidatus Brocadiia bacterium]|nr:heparinase II/III family protein [Candidatus Brocadiia bacterium]